MALLQRDITHPFARRPATLHIEGPFSLQIKVASLGKPRSKEFLLRSGRPRRTRCRGRTARPWASPARCRARCRARRRWRRCPCSSCRWRPATRMHTRWPRPRRTSPPAPPSTSPSKSAAPASLCCTVSSCRFNAALNCNLVCRGNLVSSG